MKRILIIDDSEIILDTAKDALESAGWAVTTALDPGQVRIKDIAPPDVILVDVNMREVFGDDVAQYFKEAVGVSVPVYLFSDLPEPELERRARDAGADGYISKEWGTDRLIARIGEILGK